jgi:hypothetical protein
MRGARRKVPKRATCGVTVRIDRTFRASYSVESADENVAVVPMIRGDESVAMALRISLNDTFWTAVFRFRGNGQRREVFTCPNPNELLVLCGGRASLISVDRLGSHGERIFEPVTQVVAASGADVLLCASPTGLLAYGSTGLRWEAHGLFSDDTLIAQVDDDKNLALLEGFDAITDSTKVLIVDLVTGQPAPT